MKELKVNTIYPAFMGEVNRFGIGTLCTFVRLQGCNLRCYKETKGSLCDTPEALCYGEGKLMDVSQIMQKVNSLSYPLVCLTGGEPLMQDVGELLNVLSAGYDVVVETNGSRSIKPYRHIRNVSFIVDCKSPSSGEQERMLEENYSIMNSGDYLKFVLDDERDYWSMREWIISHPYFKGNISVGLFWGSKLNYQDLLKTIIDDRLNVTLNMQSHKMMCMYDLLKDTSEFGEIFIPREL